jgi:uncharacterized membrane protein
MTGFLWIKQIGLAVWRLLVGTHASNAALKLYMGVALSTAALMAAAGYWGGELLLNGYGMEAP